EQPARGSQGCAVHGGEGQGAGLESADPGWAEVDSQRDTGIQQEPGYVRLSSGLPARRGEHSAAGRVRDLLPRAGEGVRNAAAAGERGVKQQVEDRAAAVQSFS